MHAHNLDSIELHDAKLTSTHIDYAQRVVVIELDYYPDPVMARSRVGARIEFRNVVSFSHIADLAMLEQHASAGNVTNWWPVGEGKTYLYLAGGCLIVEATEVHMESRSN